MRHGIFLTSLSSALWLFASAGAFAQGGLPGAVAGTGAISGQTGSINEPASGIRAPGSGGMPSGAAAGQPNGANGTMLNGARPQAGIAAGQTDTGPTGTPSAATGINTGKAKTYNSYTPGTVQGQPFSTGNAGSFSGSEPSTQGASGGLAH